MLITARTPAHKYLGSLILGGLFLILSIPTGAVTPVEIVKLTAEGNEVANAFFGWSVDLEGDTAVVGAYRESYDTFDEAGAAYVFTRSVEGVWSRQTRLIAPDRANRDHFGYRVAVSGDTIIIGAWLDDDLGTSSGSAYVFVRSLGVWSLQQKLVASDGAAFDYFGSAIALDGDTAFFGVGDDDYDVDGDGVDDLFDAGSVYIFTRNGSFWTQEGKLHPDDPQDGHYFGGVALDGNSLLITAGGDADSAGAAYVFTGSGSSWTQQAKLTASDPTPGDRLGTSAALSANTAILGAPYVDKAYVFVRDGVTWTQQAKLTASDDSAARDFFGIVALSGDTAVIGADAADEGCFLFDSGAAYVFTRSDGLWTERAKLGASDATAKEWFGKDVAMFGDTVLITAPTSLLGGSNEWKGGPGSMYVFDFGIDDAGVWNALDNGSFETSDLSGWFNLEGSASVGVPSAGAQDGAYAAVLTPETPGTGASIMLQNFPARPGDEFYASGYMLTENTLVDVPAARIIKLGFYHLDCDPFSFTELAPEEISKGVGGADTFPGIEGLPLLDSSSALNKWQFTQSQGVAPAGTNSVSILLFNINETGSAAPIWFDNIVVARLVPDMDSDGIANDVDTDPLADTGEFSDGTTSGTVTDPGNQTLAISDEPYPDGVRITAASGGSGAAATVSVCNETANLTFSAGDDVVVTCGSVTISVWIGPLEALIELNGVDTTLNIPPKIAVEFTPDTGTLAVTAEPDSEPQPVIVETTINNEPATLTVPPEIAVTIAPDTGTLTVEATSDPDPGSEPPPVILEVGGAVVPIEPGEALLQVDIDIKPGSDPNCFNINGKGVIPVAVLGSPTFDVEDINRDSLSFGGLLVRIQGNELPSCGLKDTNADGFDDLVCHFEDKTSSNWTVANGTATLSGKLSGEGGLLFSGTDPICIVP